MHCVRVGGTNLWHRAGPQPARMRTMHDVRVALCRSVTALQAVRRCRGRNPRPSGTDTRSCASSAEQSSHACRGTPLPAPPQTDSSAPGTVSLTPSLPAAARWVPPQTISRAATPSPHSAARMHVRHACCRLGNGAAARTCVDVGHGQLTMHAVVHSHHPGSLLRLGVQSARGGCHRASSGSRQRRRRRSVRRLLLMRALRVGLCARQLMAQGSAGRAQA
jgi:hypothetical protein